MVHNEGMTDEYYTCDICDVTVDDNAAYLEDGEGYDVDFNGKQVGMYATYGVTNGLNEDGYEAICQRCKIKVLEKAIEQIKRGLNDQV